MAAIRLKLKFGARGLSQEASAQDAPQYQWIHLQGTFQQDQGLALQSALSEIQVPRVPGQALHPHLNHAYLQDYGPYVYVTLYHFHYVQGLLEVYPVAFHMVVSQHGIVSWTEADLSFVDDLADKLQAYPELVTSQALLLYFIVDALLGGIFPFLDEINEQIGSLEREILTNPSETTVQRKVLGLKRVVMHARRILASMRDVIHHLVGHVELKERQVVYYFELYDHVLRLFDTVDTYRELLSSILDVHLSTVSNRLNTIVKTLTLVTTLMLPASLLAALYGMNFDYLPGAHQRWGFFGILALVGAISGGLLVMFKRRHWF